LNFAPMAPILTGMARNSAIGKPYTPPDLVAKVTGRAKYAEDFRAEGMLFAKLLLSPLPHARVRRIDAGEALSMEGVFSILTAEDFPDSDPLVETPVTSEPLYVGQPILALAAADELTAADAIEKIRVDLEPLPFVLDPLESLRPDGPDARLGGNIMRDGKTLATLKWTREVFAAAGPDELPLGEAEEEWSYGDLQAGFAQADLIVDETLFHQSQTHHPLETRSCMAFWQNGKLHVFPSTQSTAQTVVGLARELGLNPGDVVMINAYTGGGFGSKARGTVNMAIPALLSRKTGRPVMHRVTREEETSIGRARPGFQARVKMGFRKDGRVTALDLFIVQDTGPYGRRSDITTAAEVASLAYTPLAMRYRGVSVLTNTPTRSAQRAPGGVQITSMLEPLIDRAAAELSVDRMAIRRINAPSGPAKLGAHREPITYAYAQELFDKAEKLFDWTAESRSSGRRRGSKVSGVGLGFSTYHAGSRGFDGLCVIRPDGGVEIHTGAGNLGTGSFSDAARVVAEALSVPWEKCVVHWGDTTENLPWTSIQAGSMTISSCSRANYAGAMDARRKLQEIAAGVLGGAPGDYELGGERVYRKGQLSRGMSLGEAASRAIALGGKFDGHELEGDLNEMTVRSATALAGQGLIGAAKDKLGGEGELWSFVLGFAKLELDIETAHVDLLRYDAVCDCGRVINPRGLAAQLHGGGLQGVGLARTQRWVYDPRWGIGLTGKLYQAKPPTILDVPLEMKADFVDLPDPSTPVGARGIGEAAFGAGVAAVVCALQDAVGKDAFKRTPLMTDFLLNLVEGRPQPYGTLTAHV
jgi:xanthine dehydrogenase molybdenum-binding subunit